MSTEGLASVERAFDSVLDSEDYLESRICDEAIAAAESLAVLLKVGGSSIPDEVKSWVDSEKRQPTDRLIAKGKGVLDRIVADSELKELWEDTDDFEKWRSLVSDLSSRLIAVRGIGDSENAHKPWWRFWK
ncbi:DUF4259 domain-containing protein [Nibricoccus sp. IMCC34717]|uniref:DUF4259 domain-containing protein n=1 Tax=Nibricoccus sp. IMCC34717 TaxID=3034021 RepID=UPI00384DAC34